MTAPDPYALTARFLEACGREAWQDATPPWGDAVRGRWLYLPAGHDDGPSLVPDFTVEGELGRVVRMWEGAHPHGQWRIFCDRSTRSPACEAVVWIDFVDFGELKLDGDGEADDDLPGVAFMLAAIDAAGLERPEGR